MRLVKRSAIIFSLAAFVPILLLGSFYTATLLQQTSTEVQTKTLSRAVQYLGHVDGRLSVDVGILFSLTNSQPFRSGAWNEARGMTLTATRALPHWKNVVLLDVSKAGTIWQTAEVPENAVLSGTDLQTIANSGHEIGDFLAIVPECLCVTLQSRFTVNGAAYLLLVQRDVTDFQHALMAVILPGEIAALVDRKGLFLARTADYARRLGRPATQFVRDAILRGGQDIYPGITYEGMKNRTAYATSALSGWSAHIAVPATTFTLLSAGYLMFGLLAILTAVGFAGAVIWYASHDLAKQRHEELTKMRSLKLEAVGYFSGAVVHDINNLLALMTSCIRMLDKPRDEASKHRIVQEGLEAAKRGENLVRQLLTFTRDKPLDLNCINLDATINGIQELLVRTLGPDIASVIKLGSNARHVRTNAPQLELVLLNLAVNARDAMPDGGTLSITSKLAPTPGCIDLVVKDTGTGMSKDVAARAMEPFFTTKPEGKGTGLGLAQAHMLMKECGGSIHLETEPHKGAEFTLRFPECKPP